MALNNLVPMLNISDIETSLAFYRRALAFEVVSDPKAVTEWRWATIRSGGTTLMLSESLENPGSDRDPDPHSCTDWPAIYYFYPDDVEALYNHVLKQGYHPTKLDTTLYGMREFSLKDPDGHILSFGEDADK